MRNTRWYSKLTKMRTSDTFLLGIWFVKNINAWGCPNMHLTIAIGGSRWKLWFYEASKHERPTKPDKPSLGEGVRCIVGISGLQLFFWWMDSAASKDLFVAFVIIMAAFAAWGTYRLTRRK